MWKEKVKWRKKKKNINIKLATAHLPHRVWWERWRHTPKSLLGSVASVPGPWCTVLGGTASVVTSCGSHFAPESLKSKWRRQFPKFISKAAFSSNSERQRGDGNGYEFTNQIDLELTFTSES